MSEITKEQAASAAIQVLKNEQTLEQSGLTPEMIAAVRELITGTFFDAEIARQQSNVEVNKHTKPDRMLELIRLLDLEAQYGECLNTLKHYGFLDENGEAKEGDVAPPSFEKAMDTFRPEELEIASTFQKPTLLLIPETSFAAKVRALDAHKQGIQKNDTYADKTIYPNLDLGFNKITGWRVVIVDGAREMGAYDGDDPDLRFGERIENRKATRKPGEKGMDRHKYILLMMEAIRNNAPIDKESSTLLEDDPALSDPYVLDAFFDPGYRRVSFLRDRSDESDNRVRFRSSVGGDVLLT